MIDISSAHAIIDDIYKCEKAKRHGKTILQKNTDEQRLNAIGKLFTPTIHGGIVADSTSRGRLIGCISWLLSIVWKQKTTMMDLHGDLDDLEDITSFVNFDDPYEIDEGDSENA